MPRGDKSKYTDKQKRQAEHIEEGYEKRGVPEKVAASRAWATVNKESGGGNKSGKGRGVKDTNVSSKRGGNSAEQRLRRELRNSGRLRRKRPLKLANRIARRQLSRSTIEALHIESVDAIGMAAEVLQRCRSENL